MDRTDDYSQHDQNQGFQGTMVFAREPVSVDLGHEHPKKPTSSSADESRPDGETPRDLQDSDACQEQERAQKNFEGRGHLNPGCDGRRAKGSSRFIASVTAS